MSNLKWFISCVALSRAVVTMRAPRRRCADVALALLALAACAIAFPENNNIVTAAKTPAPVNLAASQPLDSRPINERFPHAVLFGGTCGGSIISPKWVLTAGHCTLSGRDSESKQYEDKTSSSSDESKVFRRGVSHTLFTSGRYVLAGTNNSENLSGVTVRVKRLIIHPRFSVGPYWLSADQFNIKQVGARWDFLLAELEEPLKLDGKIAVAKLDDLPLSPQGLEVGYAGFGAARHGETMREDMHGMELIVMSNETCSNKLEQFEPLDMLCVQGRPPRYDSACNGDSGSGLVDARGRLLGVASWVEDDAHECRNGALVVFSRVALVREWIRNITGV